MYRFRDTLPIDISRKTISGDLVTIENPEEMGVVDSLEVSLSPIQDLHGYDKPWVGGAGKNLIALTDTTNTSTGVTITATSEPKLTFNGTRSGRTTVTTLVSDVSLPAGTYILNGGQSGDAIGFQVYNLTKNTTHRDTSGSGVTFTVSEGDALEYRVYVRENVTASNMVRYPMIRLATETDATYEPYSNVCPISGRTEVDTIVSPTTSATDGQTYTTALGRTVYGGTLDVVSGELVVDRAIVDLGSLNWSAYGATASYDRYVTAGIDSTVKEGTVGLSSHFQGSRTFAVGNIVIGSGGAKLSAFTPKGQYASASDFKTAMSGATFVYELATPQTYQLTPQQIDLLLGTNHLWSDGEISVTWHKDLTKGRILPTEAVSINGQYIENVLDGYRTLYTKGRESLGAKLETYSVGTADGEKFKSKRYPARTITVGFQLIGENPQDFREKFNNLNNLLAIEEADFIFNDETDKFFSGYPIMDASVEAGQDSVKGEWKIYCTYPFKRSVEPIRLTMEDATVTDTTATFTIDYKGARPARPVLRAKFAGAKSGGSSSEDGDCGFVAFMDGEENIIQLGNPEILDLDEYVSAETFINKEFVNVSDWTRTGGHTYKGTVTGSVSTSDTVDAFWNGGAGQTQTYAKPSYGSGSDLHGAILWKNTAGAVNFTMNMVHRICCANPSETGVFECGAYNHSTGVLVAGFIIDKSANGTTGIVRYIVNGVQVGTDQIDLSYYNTHFGYCNRTPVYITETYYDPVWFDYRERVRYKKKKKKKKKYVTKSRLDWVTRTRTVFSGWNYTQSNLNSSIQKDGSYVYFQVGNLPMRTFNVPAVAQVLAHDASVYMGTYGTALNTNMIHSLLFRRDAGVPFAEQPNVFTAGDIVEADCNEATVYIYRDGSIGGHLEPQFGALGNDWEDFMLTSGTNVIRATWSEWVNTSYKPQIEIEYNEVFI